MQMCQVCLGAMSEKAVKENGVYAGRGGVRHKVCPAPPVPSSRGERIMSLVDSVHARKDVYSALSDLNRKTRGLMDDLQHNHLKDLELKTIFDDLFSDLSRARDAAVTNADS